jgi:hypothetical protein
MVRRTDIESAAAEHENEHQKQKYQAHRIRPRRCYHPRTSPLFLSENKEEISKNFDAGQSPSKKGGLI